MGCPRMAPWPLPLAQRRPPSPPLSPLLLMPPNHLGFLLAEGRASAQCPGCNPAGALTAPATQPHPPLARLTEGLARPEASEEVQHQGLEPGFLRSCVCVLRGGGRKRGRGERGESSHTTCEHGRRTPLPSPRLPVRSTLVPHSQSGSCPM